MNIKVDGKLPSFKTRSVLLTKGDNVAIIVECISFP